MMRFLAVITLLYSTGISTLAQTKIIDFKETSIELNTVAGFRPGSTAQLLNNRLDLSVFDKLNLKIGYGVLDINQPYSDDVYSINMNLLSILAYINPVNTKLFDIKIGMGFVELRQHKDYADIITNKYSTNETVTFQHIITTNLWRPAIEYCIDLDFKVTSSLRVGCQTGFFDIIDRKDPMIDGFFTAGLKIGYKILQEKNQ